MRFVWLFFVGLIAAMVVVLPRLNHSPAPTTPQAPGLAGPSKQPLTTPASVAVLHEAPPTGSAARADSVVAFGLAQRGTPYVFAGTSPLTGFDCSGFIMYTFAHFKVAVPHSTALLIDVGQPVARPDARPGDIVVFTGTATTSSTPGHAGIVVSGRGEVPLRFVHASSARRESGVKVSQVEGTDYERRFMQVRRVLGVPAVAVVARAKGNPQPVAAVPAALPVRPVAVKPTAAPLALPPTLPLHRVRRPSTSSKRSAASTHKTLRKKVLPKAKRAASVTRPIKPKSRTTKQPVRAVGHRKARATTTR